MKPFPCPGWTVGVLRRREFVANAPSVLLGMSTLLACSQALEPESYESVASRIRRADAAAGVARQPLGQELPRDLPFQLVRELVRSATVEPSSHNTQCWKFALHINTGKSMFAAALFHTIWMPFPV